MPYGNDIRVVHKTNTPGIRGGPGGCNQTLTVKSRKNARKITIFSPFFTFLLVMPKYGGEQNFSHRSFPEVGEKQKA